MVYTIHIPEYVIYMVYVWYIPYINHIMIIFIGGPDVVDITAEDSVLSRHVCQS